MSQHTIGVKTASGKNVNVQVGWDRPLGRYYMVIEDLDGISDDVNPEDPDEDFNEEEMTYLYSNLSDNQLRVNPALANTTTYFRQKAIDLGIHIPDQIWHEVMLDGRNNVGNKEVNWNPDGTIEK